MGDRCEYPPCGKPASLVCPTCTKLGLPPSRFCSQECFRHAWKEHKKVHALVTHAKPLDTLPPIFRGYPFTGPLRPAYVSPIRSVPPTIAAPDYATTGDPISEKTSKAAGRIEVLSPEDIEKMRTVSRLAREVIDEAGRAVRPGVTTEEIDRIVHEACLERHSYPSPLNYYGFPKSCCTSVNEVICHGIPDARELQDGDICNIDITLYHDGFHGDVNETFCVGNVDEASKKLIQVTYECLDQAIQAVKPGTLFRELGSIIQRHAHANGFQVVRSYCGHGVHRLFHCPPTVPHYAKSKAIGVMKQGQTFTIEPMINTGSWRDQQWPDGWTAVTVDGKRSAQFEHTLLVTETGCDVLTARLEGSPPHCVIDGLMD